MNLLFLAAGPMIWYSSRARCYWVAECMENARAVQLSEAQPDDLARADVVVFQKTFDIQAARALRQMGKKIIWDVCDPMWWFDPKGSAQILEHIDGAVCSNMALAADFAGWVQGRARVYTIDDRIKLDHYPLRRAHTAVNPLRLIWFGLGVNRFALMGGIAILERAAANGIGVELTIFDDRPEDNWQYITRSFPIYHTRYTLETENQVLAAHDAAILPIYPGAWGRVKSNNRTLTAWACGLPVIDGMHYGNLLEILSPEKRRDTSEMCLGVLQKSWAIEQSAAEWDYLCFNLMHEGRA